MTKPITRKPKTWKKILLPAVVLLLVAGSLAFGVIFYKKYQDLKKQPLNTAELAQAERDRIIAELGQIYELPKDEQPTAESVKDKTQLSDQLKNQPFFEGVENGDWAVVYTKAKLAILYRPSIKKIIRVSNVTVQEAKPNVVILGAEASRDAAEAALTGLKDSFTLAAKSDAKTTQEQTIVVDVSGKHGETAAKLATAIPGATLGSLPEGEDRPANADIVIITSAGQ